MNTKRFITLALGGVLLASPVYLAAQQDQGQGQESVADAARKALADKKVAPKPKMVIDNDNLDTLSGTINVVGETPAATDDQAKKAADEKTQKSGESAKGETYWRQKFADANKKLTDDQHELDIMQREYNLKQQQYYADPMATLKQEYTRQDLNDSKTKIDDKTAVVAQDKADISDLEDQLRQAGGDPGWATPPAQPAPESAPKP
jgi:chromosome segregation ATPase